MADHELYPADGDPRVKDWLLMSSCVPTVAVTIVYLMSIYAGCKWMKTRPAMNVSNVMAAYNFVLVVLSATIVYEFLASGWLAGYSFVCQPVDYSDSPQALRMTRVCWLFYFSKIIELLDTWFFIVRKKFHLITYLHVIHHATMPLGYWIGVSYLAGGLGTFHALINSAVHFIMYIYYGMAACGWHELLWWKKYLTSLQIGQFIIVIVHSVVNLLAECAYPKAFLMSVVFLESTFLGLFANFFIKAYLSPGRKKVE